MEGLRLISPIERRKEWEDSKPGYRRIVITISWPSTISGWLRMGLFCQHAHLMMIYYEVSELGSLEADTLNGKNLHSI